MKKLILCLSLLFSMQYPIYADEEAKELSVEVQLNGEAAPSELLDNSIYTQISFQDGDVLHLTSSESIRYVYIKYASTPTPFTMNIDGVSTEVATHGFLHELIPLEKATKTLQFNLSTSQICDIFVFGEGKLPPSIQNFSLPYDQCDMLVFPTHADDDTLYFGIPITLYADLGYRIQIAYLTNHNDTVDRPHELLDGLWEMGITTYPLISEFSDIRAMSLESALEAYDEDAVLKYEVDAIRRCKPNVILGHDENGEYGHGVHMLNTYLLKQAIELSGDPTYFPESATRYGIWSPLKTYLHMYPIQTIYLDENTLLHDGLTSIQKAKDGYSKHLSQHQWVLDVIPSGEGDCRMFGLYQTQVGEDTSTNMFEHVEKVEDTLARLKVVHEAQKKAFYFVQFLFSHFFGFI